MILRICLCTLSTSHNGWSQFARVDRLSFFFGNPLSCGTCIGEGLRSAWLFVRLVGSHDFSVLTVANNTCLVSMSPLSIWCCWHGCRREAYERRGRCGKDSKLRMRVSVCHSLRLHVWLHFCPLMIDPVRNSSWCL